MSSADVTFAVYLRIEVLLSPSISSLVTRITRQLDDPDMRDLKVQLMTAFDRHRSFAVAVDNSSCIQDLERGVVAPHTELLDGCHRLRLITEELSKRVPADEAKADDVSTSWITKGTMVNVVVFVCRDPASRIAIAYGEIESAITVLERDHDEER